MKLKLALFVVLSFATLVPLLLSPIMNCSAQQSGQTSLTITYDEYNWNSDMKHVAMTTPDKGLVFEITLYNNSTKSFDISQGFSNSLYIFIILKNNDNPQLTTFSKTLTFDLNNGGLYLPPYESEVRYVKVADSMGNNLPIGSYTAELSYSNNQFYYGSQGTPIGTYPFNFKVETPEILQKTIEQNPLPTNQILVIVILIALIAIVVIVGIALIVLKFSKKQGGKVSRKQKDALKYIEVVSAIITLVLGILSFYLQLIRW